MLLLSSSDLLRRTCVCGVLVLSLSDFPAARSHGSFGVTGRFTVVQQPANRARQLRHRPAMVNTGDGIRPPGIDEITEAYVTRTGSSDLACSATSMAKTILLKVTTAGQRKTTSIHNNAEDMFSASTPGNRARQAVDASEKKDAKSVLVRVRSMRRAVLVRGAGTGGTVTAATITKSAPGQSARGNAIDGLKNGLASGLAAAVVKTALQPFDTMKTVQQYSKIRMTLIQAGRELLARGGIAELYQGLGVTLVGSMPSVGVYFGLYQFVKKQIDSHGNISPYLSVTISAGVGNFVASFFRVPYEVVKQRLQVGAYPTTMVALKSIYQEGGLIGFFGKGGLKTQWARDIPYAMVTLLVYETLQNYAAKRRGSVEKKGSPLENMVIGAIAGGMGSLVTNPMDMVKTRMMTSPELYESPMDAAWKALKAEGPQAFMKGATPRLMHKIPANAFFFVVYEFFRNVLGVTR